MHVADPYKEMDWIVENAQNPNANHSWRFSDWYDWHTEVINYEREVKKLSTAKRQLGWSAGGTMKRVACFPTHIFELFRKLNPEFGRNNGEDGRKALHKIIQRYPMFSVPAN